MLEASSNQPVIEIERKFLVKTLPDYQKYPYVSLLQVYLPDGSRIRKEDDIYIQIIKSGSGGINTETPIKDLSEEEFLALLLQSLGKPIRKTRYKIPVESNHIAELDIYHDDLDGFLTVEVEFLDEEDFRRFTPPPWFGKEVTGDNKYSNYNLSFNGLPALG